MTSYATELLFDQAAQDIDREDRRLQALENAGTALIIGSFDVDGVAAMSRAMTYVICGGLLEWLMRELPQALVDDIISTAVIRGNLPIGLLAVLEAPTFRKCIDKTPGGLLARVELLLTVSQHSKDVRPVDDFRDNLVLADGTTIGVVQFEAIWQTLGLAGDWQNRSSDILLLRELRSKRNEVAHWENDPVLVGRSRTYSDLRALLRQLRDLLDHLCLNVCDWLDKLAAP